MTKHNIKPDFIFVYRDGVAESQLNQVVSNVTLGVTRVILIENILRNNMKSNKCARPAPLLRSLIWWFKNVSALVS
jgi:hypothetical protein